MDMLFIWLARIAGIVLVISYIPQQMKIVYNRSSKDVSLSMYLILFCALLVYEVYAIGVKEPVFMFTNSMSLIQCSVMLGLIAWFGRKQ